jgi:hypothetical protein
MGRVPVPMFIDPPDGTDVFVCSGCGRDCVEGVDAVVCSAHFGCGHVVAEAVCTVCALLLGGYEATGMALTQSLPAEFGGRCPVCSP